MPQARRAVFSADDFGLSLAVNEAVEHAHRAGVLGAASLMVGAPAAADAARRARALPGLRVGLHLVVIEGQAVLPPSLIPDLVDARGWFASDQLRLGLRYFLRPAIRRQLAAEIEAQFAAFDATGLALDHANAHKHMHLHPTIARLLIAAGKRHGLRAVRVPHEPAWVAPDEGIGAAALRHWTRLLRRQVRRAGMFANDHVFGLAWSGHMTRERLLTLIPRLPDGFSEIYLHPASRPDQTLRALMPDYEPLAELAALVDPALRAALAASGVRLTSYSAQAGYR